MNAAGKAASSYMQALVKETTTLHRVLAKILPPDEIKVLSLPSHRGPCPLTIPSHRQQIFTTVYEMFNTRLIFHYTNLNLDSLTPAGRKR